MTWTSYVTLGRDQTISSRQLNRIITSYRNHVVDYKYCTGIEQLILYSAKMNWDDRIKFFRSKLYFHTFQSKEEQNDYKNSLTIFDCTYILWFQLVQKCDFNKQKIWYIRMMYNIWSIIYLHLHYSSSTCENKWKKSVKIKLFFVFLFLRKLKIYSKGIAGYSIHI